MKLEIKKADVPEHLHKYFTKKPAKYKSGDLVNIPHLVADALQSDGWVLRQDIVWSKPSPMPESVKNRCTKAHEYIFLLTKRGSGYFYDMEAIKETGKDWSKSGPGVGIANTADRYGANNGGNDGLSNLAQKYKDGTQPNSRNKRSVWTVSSQGYDGAHFATFPPKLITPCIRAGTSSKGCCPSCGTPWRRVVEEKKLTRERPNDFVKYKDTSHEKKQNTPGKSPQGGWDKLRQEDNERKKGVNSCPNSVDGVETKTVGWEPSCECHGKFVKVLATKTRTIGSGPRQSEKKQNTPGMSPASSRSTLYSPGNHPSSRSSGVEEYQEEVEVYQSDISLEDHPITACTVLDPFIGSGTTAVVSIELGRDSIGIDLSEKYLRDNAIPRIKAELLNRPELAWLAGQEKKALRIGKEI